MPNVKTQIAVAVILADLGIHLSVDSKDDRLKIQKAIYLAQAAGAKLGYSFNWYVNGPYSPSLADDYYEAAKNVEELKKYVASEDLSKLLKPVKDVIEAKPEGLSDVHWLEAVGSLDYMRRVQRRPVESLVRECLAQKPHLEQELQPAFGALSETGFIS